MTNFSIFDGAVVGIYLIACIVLGMFFKKRITSIKEFSIGNKALTTHLLVATIYATLFDSSGTMGFMERAYSAGMTFIVIIVVAPAVFWLITSYIFSNEGFTKFKDCISLSEIMNRISGPVGLWSCNIGSLCFAVGTVGYQTLALGQIGHYLFGFEPIYGMIIGIGIITLYSFFGGIKAVIMTDLLQFWVFVIGIPLSIIIEFGKTAQDVGMGNIFNSLPSDLTTINFISEHVLTFFIFILPATHYAFVQRYLMSESPKQLSRSFTKLIWITMFFSLSVCLGGFMVRIQAPNIDPNDAFLYFVEHSTIAGVKGLLLAGLLAIIMSTADSWLQSAGVIFGHDILKPLFPKINDVQQIIAAKLFIIVVAVCAVLIATQMNSILDGFFMASNFWDPIIAIPLCSAIFGFRSIRISYKIATVTAIMGIGVGYFIDGQLGALSTLCGIAGNAIGLFGTHFIVRPPLNEMKNITL